MKEVNKCYSIKCIERGKGGSWEVILNVEIREGLADKEQVLFEGRSEGGVGEGHVAGGRGGEWSGEGCSKQRWKRKSEIKQADLSRHFPLHHFIL